MAGSLKARVSLNVVKQLQPGDEVRDTDLKGFGVRRLETVTSYFLHTRVKGRLRRITIGKHGSPWTPDSARREASRMLLEIRQGQDPTNALAEQRLTSEKFGTIAQRFLDHHGTRLKPSSRADYERLITLQLGPTFGERPVSEIGRQEVARAHASWKATPRQANYALAVLSKVLKWAQEQGYRKSDEDACAGIERYRESKRQRYLRQDELERLGGVLARRSEHGDNPYVIAAIRTLILTGARLSEVLELRWEHVDWDGNRLCLPDSKTGAKVILLSQAAREVLAAVPRIEQNPWVFAGQLHGTHLVNIHKAWSAIRKEANIPDVRIHDLRHSYASVAVGLGGSLPIIGHLLGHSQPQTTARYAHVGVSPARELGNLTGDAIGAALGLARKDSAAK